MQAALDPHSRWRLQPRLRPMHSGRPPLRPCIVQAKTSFPPRHTHTRASMTAVNVSITRIPRLCLPVRKNQNPAVATNEQATISKPATIARIMVSGPLFSTVMLRDCQTGGENDRLGAGAYRRSHRCLHPVNRSGEDREGRSFHQPTNVITLD